MTTFLQRDDFAVTARVLGALFYYSPESHETAPLVQALLTDDWQAQWPLDAEALAPVAAMFKTHSEESLPQAWQRLFIGPYALPSPPWGSVWLDRAFMDIGPAILIFTPILLPIMAKLGVDPVHFGIIMIYNLAIGTITPPVGSGLYVGASVGKVKVEEVIKPLLPFYGAIIGVLLLITYIPEITLFLPRLLGIM